MDESRKQMRRMMENMGPPISTTISMTGVPEITFRAFDEAGDVAGEVELYLAEASDGWYLAVLLIIEGEPRLVVRDEHIGDTHDEALEAAVLRANDAVNELGYTADL